MSLIKIEWEFGKPYADKLIIYYFRYAIYLIIRFVRIFRKNYYSFRKKSRVPGIGTFNMKIVIKILLSLMAISAVAFYAGIFLSDGSFNLVVGISLVVLGIASLLFILVFTVMALLDFGISLICVFRALHKTLFRK
jgi:magnesium-transporting ATPase (P-type)